MPILGIYASSMQPAINATSFESIATYTASGSETSFTFSSIPAGYKHLQIRASYQFNSNSDALIGLQLNGDTGNNYSYHSLVGDGSSASAGNTTSYSSMLFLYNYPNWDTNQQNAAIVDILDFTSTNKNKTVRALNGGDVNGGGKIGLYSGAWYSTSAVTSVSVIQVASHTFKAGSKIALYGIK